MFSLQVSILIFAGSTPRASGAAFTEPEACKYEEFESTKIQVLPFLVIQSELGVFTSLFAHNEGQCKCIHVCTERVCAFKRGVLTLAS